MTVQLGLKKTEMHTEESVSHMQGNEAAEICNGRKKISATKKGVGYDIPYFGNSFRRLRFIT